MIDWDLWELMGLLAQTRRRAQDMGFVGGGMGLYGPCMMVFLAPAMILAFIAQMWLKSAFARGKEVPVKMTGYEAARHILDQAGLRNVDIEPVEGTLSDHYDPRAKVLRLSRDVFYGQNASAVGVAAHEAGHALQDAARYPFLVVRNAAVPIANIGGSFSFLLIMAGAVFISSDLGFWLIIAGVALFSGVVFFQIVNLPVEFDASSRAKRLLSDYGIIGQNEYGHVRSVLSAAAMTYVAGTLQSVLTLLYYLMIAFSRRR